MYIFKRKADGAYIFGTSPKSTCSTGKYRSEPSSDFKRVKIFSINRGLGEDDFDELVTSFLDEDGLPYANFADFDAATAEFFSRNKIQSINSEGLDTSDLELGKYGCQIITGAAKTSILEGHYAYACSCRVADSKIASLEKTVDEVVSADTNEAITGIAMYQGEFIPFRNKVTSVTQTLATDSITYWLKPL